MHDLTGFQRDSLYVIAGLGDPKGIAIMSELNSCYDVDIAEGRLYPALNDLIEQGYVSKGTKDAITNEYRLTEAGVELLKNRRNWEGQLPE